MICLCAKEGLGTAMGEPGWKNADNLPEPVFFGMSESAGDMVIRNHFHNRYEILLVQGGQAEFEIAGKHYEAGPGSLFFISNFEHHEIKIVSQPYKRSYLLIKPEYMQNLAGEPAILSIFKYRPEGFRHKIQLSPRDAGLAGEAIAKIIAELDGKGDFYDLSVRCQLNLLLIDLYRKYGSCFPIQNASRAQILVLKAQEHIELHCGENLELKELAAMYYTDMYYLSRLFKKHTGYSFKEYVILQRVARAKEMLLNTDLPVTRVCTDSGFNNINHFIRMFRNVTGMPPLKYRKAARDKGALT